MAPVFITDVYTAIVEMSNVTDPLSKWRSTYDFFSPTVPVASDPIIDSMSSLNAFMLHTGDQVDKVSVYVWARGAQPYPNGNPLFVKAYGVTGTADSHWYPPLTTPYVANGAEVCARIDRQTITGGKPGRLFMRRFFGQHDVVGSDAGEWVTTMPISDYESQLAVVVSAVNLNQHFYSGTSPQKLVVTRYSKRPGAPPPSATYVTDLHFIDVTTSKTTRKGKK